MDGYGYGRGDVAAVAAGVVSLSTKTGSLPRSISGVSVSSSTSPQWPTLQAGSIVSDYITNLDIVSDWHFLSSFICRLSSLWLSSSSHVLCSFSFQVLLFIPMIYTLFDHYHCYSSYSTLAKFMKTVLLPTEMVLKTEN